MPNNPENILPHRIRTAEEAREKGRAGGMRSGVKRREQASLREAARLILSMDVQSPEAQRVLEKLGLDPDERTNAAALTAAMVAKAAAGDVKAYEALSRNMGALDDSEAAERDKRAADAASAGLAGLPAIDTASFVPGCYSDAWRDIMAHGHSEYIGESGRGSLKSTVLLSLAPVMLMLKDPRLCGVAFRRVGNTLRDSIFASLVSAIRRLGVESEFEWTTSPMRISRPSTRQVILFRGLDDEEKAKSLTLDDPGLYIGFACWEEFDQQKGERAVRRVEQTIKRGAAPMFWTFRAFNTPADPEHWAHLYAARMEGSGEALVMRSTYLDVPPEFLGEEFLADAERLKAVSEEAYRNEYLGEAVGLTGRVFANVEAQEISQEQAASLKWIRRGIDWGFQQDPFVWLTVGYDRKTSDLYILDELFNTETLDGANIERAKERMAERDESGAVLRTADGSPVFKRHRPENECRCDAAAPKDIATWRAGGIEAVGASKRVPVADGIRWLAKRRRIVIDRKRCPLAYQEFTRYRALEDDEGRFLGYPDKDNHAIDAVRYAAFDLIADPDIP